MHLAAAGGHIEVIQFLLPMFGVKSELMSASVQLN